MDKHRYIHRQINRGKISEHNGRLVAPANRKRHINFDVILFTLVFDIFYGTIFCTIFISRKTDH